ncbi:hypothetical protein BJ741DRAFT_592120 [Chytriomyces cf. hyalinus JEL632]|nr:hypothetical protein BJ741DRAFT_592120 [Chytriomyces cf. hyalinus JEL632]
MAAQVDTPHRMPALDRGMTPPHSPSTPTASQEPFETAAEESSQAPTAAIAGAIESGIDTDSVVDSDSESVHVGSPALPASVAAAKDMTAREAPPSPSPSSVPPGSASTAYQVTNNAHMSSPDVRTNIHLDTTATTLSTHSDPDSAPSPTPTTSDIGPPLSVSPALAVPMHAPSVARSHSSSVLASASNPKRFSFFGMASGRASVSSPKITSTSVPLPPSDSLASTQTPGSSSGNILPPPPSYDQSNALHSLEHQYTSDNQLARRVTKRNTFDATNLRNPTNFPTGMRPIASLSGLGQMENRVVATGADDRQILREAFPESQIPIASYLTQGNHALGYGRDGRMKQIIMNWNDGFDFRIEAPLSPGIGHLVCLTMLQLNNHRLGGSLPTSFGMLVNLKELCLAGNCLNGPLPDSMCNLSNLEVLDLHDNQFSAPLPLEICRLTNLRILRLNNNQITGTIPLEIGRISGLQQLYLGHNRMEGPIPKSICLLSKLELLQLQHNKLTGEIPADLGHLKSLKFLFLNSNRLIGELNGSMFTNFRTLEYLLLNRNQFSGDIPQALLNLRQTQILRLDNNYLNPASKDQMSFSVKLGVQLGFKKIVLRPQNPGQPPYLTVPEYTEFPPDVLHPSDHVAAQRSRGTHRLTSLFDLPDNPNRWTPAEVAFWVKYYGANDDVCRSIIELQMTGGQFFRLGEGDLESALGMWDPNVRLIVGGAMQRVLAQSNGLLPPDYEG